MSEQAWEVVNTKQKKQQKTQKKKEEKESQKKRELQEKQEEERRRKEVEDAFLQQYVLAKNQSPLAPAEDTSVSNPFEAFKVIEKKQRKLAQNDMLLPEDDYSDEEGTGPKKSKKKSSKPKVKKPSVIKVAKQIDNKQLKEILVQYTTRYPENPEIQLKNLAEQFETIFNTADTKKAPITNDTPYSLMEKETLDTVTSFMSKSPEDSLVVFFWFLLTTLISVQKPSTNATNTSGIGLRLLLQIIAKHFPHIVLKNMNSIKTLQLNNCFDIIMYVFNQFLTEKGVKNGFAVWFNVLLPLVVEVNKTSNQNKEEILKYFDRLIELSKNSTAVFGGDEAAGVNAFERIFQEKSLPDRISKHKSKLLDPTFLFGKNRVPKKLFTMLLSHGASSRAEFREQCSEMLSLDDNCYSYWKDSYDTHIAESNNLMLWMTLHWDEYKLQEKFKAKELFEVLKSFTKVNKSMLAGEYQDKKNKKVKKLNKSEVAELTTVNATSKALRKKLTKYAKEEGSSNGGGSSNVLLSVLPVAVVVAGAAAYTILNCCNQEWCSNIEFMNQLLKCGI